jgi:hypothetical protein
MSYSKKLPTAKAVVASSCQLSVWASRNSEGSTSRESPNPTNGRESATGTALSSSESDSESDCAGNSVGGGIHPSRDEECIGGQPWDGKGSYSQLKICLPNK